MSLARRLFTGNASNYGDQKRWVSNQENSHYTFCITKRLLIKWLHNFLFPISFQFFIHVYFSVFLFLLCWEIEHGVEQIMIKINFFQTTL